MVSSYIKTIVAGAAGFVCSQLLTGKQTWQRRFQIEQYADDKKVPARYVLLGVAV
jgi:hypothetical protein